MQDKPNIYFALPREIMESQLAMIDLLQAMFPEPEELSLSPDTKLLISQLQHWCIDEKALPSAVPPTISATLNLSIENNQNTGISGDVHHVQLNISIPLQSSDPEPAEAPPLKVVVRQPDWMSKAEVAELSAEMPVDDVFSAIEYIRDEAPNYVKSSNQQSAYGLGNGESATAVQAGPISRVWFYFPSLSTREKRDDLVNHAPGYGLTGFVLAGKPGVLCLEGTTRNVDAYMKFIKTESWGDIPSHQKKVSERYREEGEGVQRAFSGMEEITDSLGERRGERANRGDMKALEAWLVDRGLGEAFEKVIM